MQAAFFVFLGGGIGSVLRWLTGLGAARLFGAGFPAGTLIVNLLGCFLIGVFARMIAPPETGGQNLRLLLMTGLLGGYTTFSAFALDTAGLWLRDTSVTGLLYIGLSVLGGLAMVGLGLWLGGLIAR